MALASMFARAQRAKLRAAISSYRLLNKRHGMDYALMGVGQAAHPR